MDRKIPSRCTLLGMGLLALFFGIGLVACGNGASGEDASPSSLPQQCGMILQMRSSSVPQQSAGQVQKIGDCFWHAFQQCQAATLVYVVKSIDTITQHSFTVGRNNTTCTISDAVQRTVIPKAPSAVRTFTCTTLTNDQEVLHFKGCGQDGDITIPLISSTK